MYFGAFYSAITVRKHFNPLGSCFLLAMFAPINLGIIIESLQQKSTEFRKELKVPINLGTIIESLQQKSTEFRKELKVPIV